MVSDTQSSGGGIGIHVRLRFVCREVCGFESHPEQMNIITSNYMWVGPRSTPWRGPILSNYFSTGLITCFFII